MAKARIYYTRDEAKRNPLWCLWAVKPVKKGKYWHAPTVDEKDYPFDSQYVKPLASLPDLKPGEMIVFEQIDEPD